MTVKIYSRKAMETLLSKCKIKNTAIISFHDPVGRGRRCTQDYVPIDFTVKCDRVMQIGIHDLDPEALSDYLEKLAFGKDYRFFAIPYARFANENSMQRCVKEIASKMKGNAKNQYWAGTLKEVLQYSDTRAAA